MKYKYVCDDCNTEFMIDKPIHKSSRNEFCKLCPGTGKPMKRIYGATGIKK